MSRLNRIRRKLNTNNEFNIELSDAIIQREIKRNKENGIENPKVIAFPFIIFWKRRLSGKRIVRGVFRIFEARYNVDKKKLTVVSIIHAPGIYKGFHHSYFFGKLDSSVQIFDIYIEGDSPRFICCFGVKNGEGLLKNPNKNYKQFISGSLEELEERPWIELHINFDKGNIFYNQGFYFCDYSAKKALDSLGIGFVGGLIHYFTFGLIYEGIITAISSFKPFIQTAGMVISTIKGELDK